MRIRELPRAELQGALGELLQDATLVTITPLNDNVPWAVEAAWAIARRAAFSDRRVALVDLSLEHPALSSPASDPAEEGITDAFLFGASLSHVAEPQEIPGFHFIPVGTPPSRPDDVWGSDRWQRLVNGFASQRALLVLFAPRSALERLSTAPDLAILLAERGYQVPESFAERCRELVVALPDEPLPRPEPTPLPADLLTAPGQSGSSTTSRKATTLVAAAAAVLLLVTTLGLMLLGESDETATTARGHTPPQYVAPPARPPTGNGDSLPYSVQVAAFSSPTEALETAERYEEGGHSTTVSAVRLGSRGLWYRLLVGVYPTPEEAEVGLSALWEEGLLPRPSGTILRTPAALDLGGYGTREVAATALAALRERGIAAYIVEAPDGAFRILAGAFESPEQADPQDSILRTAGLDPLLVARMGRAR